MRSKSHHFFFCYLISSSNSNQIASYVGELKNKISNGFVKDWYLSLSWRSCRMVSYPESAFWGLCIFIFLGSSFFAAIISKFLPPSNSAIISALQNDWYYCFLVPLTLPIAVISVYLHWLSMKMFKHA